MKVWLPQFMVEWSYGLSPKDQKIIMEVISKNVELFMEKWNEFSRQK